MCPPPSQTGQLITMCAVWHVWWKVSEKHKFKFLETRNLNQNAIENTFGAICLHCGSNNNPSGVELVDALKQSYRSVYGTNFEDDGASLQDKLHSFHEPSYTSSTIPLTRHDSETTDSGPDIFHIVREEQCGMNVTVCACDMKMFSVAYVSSFIAKHLLNNSSFDICKK